MVVRNVAVPQNKEAATWRYSGETKSKSEKSSKEVQETKELLVIDSITVHRTMEETHHGRLSLRSQKHAASVLKQYGVVIIPSFFSPEDCSQQWGQAAINDMCRACVALEQLGVDILHPEVGRDVRQNYQEFAMREDLRCDLCSHAGGKWMNVANDRLNSEELALDQRAVNRRHPDLLSVLYDVFYPVGLFQRGNWGRWNFEGGGPFAPKQIRAGRVGAVMSLPGCADQAVHADTPHVFDHVQLPPHYVNLFVCAGNWEVEKDELSNHFVQKPPPQQPQEAAPNFAVGQTGFIVGTHNLETCARVLDEDGRMVRTQLHRLVRPHLSPGDILLFDCRVLHFGLGNQSSRIGAGPKCWRPLLYVNYSQPWFEDKKNSAKDDASLFPSSSSVSNKI